MLQHSLLLIYRNFKRFKTTFFINLVGLSVGLAGALTIYLWVHDEWSFDRYHATTGRLFQVLENQRTAEGINTYGTAPLLAEALAEEMPEIQYAAVATPPVRRLTRCAPPRASATASEPAFSSKPSTRATAGSGSADVHTAVSTRG
jgi:hypothetical protein